MFLVGHLYHQQIVGNSYGILLTLTGGGFHLEKLAKHLITLHRAAAGAATSPKAVMNSADQTLADGAGWAPGALHEYGFMKEVVLVLVKDSLTLSGEWNIYDQAGLYSYAWTWCIERRERSLWQARVDRLLFRGRVLGLDKVELRMNEDCLKFRCAISGASASQRPELETKNASISH